IVQGTDLIARASTPSTPNPISVAPSQYWFVPPLWAIACGQALTHGREGHDGPWSSFALRVGTPAQDVRVFISTASQVSWIVLDGQGCVTGDGTCAAARGGLFNRNTSSTWNPNGFWQLGNERNLGIFANGLYGNDTIGLGYQGSGGPTLENQILATIGTEKFYLGMFAVNAKTTNYSGVAEQGQASYMTILQQQNLIPSVSFGYTAGAPYRLKKVLGSLTLGGYDQARFISNDMSFSFAPDNDRDIVVGIQSIVSRDQDGTSHVLLAAGGVNAFIDSTVPHIWLPLEACKAFEKAFGLIYDAENEIYPVTNALHQKLVTQNASITFTLGNSASGGQTIDIVLPYNSFDLQAQPPYTANATKYFPLRRAANETQYTLGRTFLQEAYLTVDWERGNFSVSQCLFNPGMTQEKLIAIKSVNATSISQHQGGSSTRNKTIGIGVGVAVPIVLLAVAIAAFIVLRKRKRKRRGERPTMNEQEDEAERIRQGFAKAELDVSVENARYEMGDGDKFKNRVHEAWVDEKARHPGLHAELIGDGSRAELIGSGKVASELSNSEKLRGPFHEMFDPSAPAVELPAGLPHELPAPPLPASSRSLDSAQSFQAGGANLSAVESPNEASPVHQPSGRPYEANQCRIPSRIRSSQSQSSISSPSAQASRDPSSLGSPREQEPFSAISPIDSIDGRGLSSLVGGLVEPPESAAPARTSNTRYRHREASSRTWR
ncbi:MAG: hypothetical protein Q9207_006561, partial [Kuettlingeria erythrocarpa]